VRFALLLGVAAALHAQGSVKSRLPTLFVIGDSTASNSGSFGWGDHLGDYFDPSKITVENRARAGRSSRTFLTEGYWDKVLPELAPGDTVLIQFGHNDSGSLDQGRARASLPGIGPETKDIVRPNGQPETVHTFGWYLRKFVADTKAKGARPIILSLTVRNIWTEGKVERGSGSYGVWSADVASSESIPFIDLTRLIADRYDELGEEKVKELFPLDHTHTSEEGADLNASLVVAGLKALQGLPLRAALSQKGRDVLEAIPGAVALTGPPLVLPEPKNPELRSLFLIGDSTVRNGRGDGRDGQWGWGEPLAEYFDPTKVNIVNRAVGGLSSRTYLTNGQWDKTAAMLKPGDTVVMQFGHNDSGPLDDPMRARGTIRGTGAETREIDNPITGKHEVVHTYGWYLRQFVAGTRAKGAAPIICTPVPRKIWKDGHIVRSDQDYAKWAAEVARSEKVPLIDLNELIARQYEALGADRVTSLFADEHTHTSREGAELNAACVIAGLNALPSNPLREFQSAKAKATTLCASK
jgi:lysophospholipase L1-like esterase